MSVKKIVEFVVSNRRTIGVIVGGIISLLGYQDIANYTVEVTSL